MLLSFVAGRITWIASFLDPSVLRRAGRTSSERTDELVMGER